MLHVGAVKRVLGDHGQRVEHREFIAEKEGAELLSNSTLHRTWEQANSE